MSSPTAVNARFTDAVTQASKGMFIGDAISMPVHWYYNPINIREDFNGWIEKYEQPKESHPSPSTLSLPKPVTCKGKTYQLIGDIILKDKAQVYREENASKKHYHQGMKAGDNTLNCHCALHFIKTLRSCDVSTSDDDVAKKLFVDYVTFMTTPGSHPDTYSEGFHRALFSDWVLAEMPASGDDLYKFLTERREKFYSDPGPEHAPTIGSFAMPLVVILHNIRKPVEEVIKSAKSIYSLTHPVKELEQVFDSCVRVLHSVVRGGSLKEEAEKAFVNYVQEGKNLLKIFDKWVEESTDKIVAFQKIGKELGLDCHVSHSYPVTLYLARAFHYDFEGGLLMNANVGGDNCGRGPVLGALLGAALGAKGKKIFSKWTDGLLCNSTLDQLLAN